ncbi:hypothetical protein MCOR27_011149 [Pyricularia oryzae]|uniref:IBR domain-containing protein n=2 Tax=Pyricularia TaxID=48558 RepID=A0ABQ8ND65_PYRGI|nr:hypothetical protein MCOR01_010168 [Pyricularia oryzae]KAI6294727.1 hypothetical protein MCOR33_008231 [Pyricularia grisea]KAI6256400.1 hypothetical protein MCOR19_007119 [Pyricularia oryzae]KAI6266090.1 hypothetical protein MCOR27_011149 [Pyricularia oryzae]KAI6269893.1 hypothetical protein MCOR26_008508 [Pyricularia oryzae]
MSLSFGSDQIMCRSIADAVTKDGDAIGNLLRENPVPPAAESAAQLDDELIEKLKVLYVTDHEQHSDQRPDSLPEAESSAWAASRKAGVRRRLKGKCISCRDTYDFTDVARCPCNHEYCRHCLSTLLEASIVDESLFPPRCCNQSIPLDHNRIFLAPDLIGRFYAKKLELETKNRTYCYDPTCSTWVPLTSINKVGSLATCVRCRKKDLYDLQGITAHR